MIDFLLNTDRDDIVLEQSNRSNTLKIQFTVAEASKKLKIQFFIETIARIKPTINPLKIKFEIQKQEDPYINKAVKSLKICQNNEDYFVQQLMIKLKTELGEIPGYGDFGSTLVEYRHKDKFDKTNLLKIKEIVKSFVDSDEYDVKVTPAVNDRQVLSWHDIHIDIINKETNNVLRGYSI